MVSTSLEVLLQDCTVKLSIPGKSGWGTGFFVAPGQILTCAHVVKDAVDQQVQIEWRLQSPFRATVTQMFPKPYDLALLEFSPAEAMEHPCVWLDVVVQSRDPLYLFGYPDEGDRQGEPATFHCEGLTGSEPPDIKFALGQVRPGMSGSALLNQRTGKICGMVKFTRDRSIDLGGGAVCASTILNQFPELEVLQQQFHRQDQRWTETQAQSLSEPEPQPKKEPKPFTVPYPRNPYFTGRAEMLAQIHATLGQTGAAALSQAKAIHGLGGVGKTQTAVEYAYRYFEDELIYDWVFWVNASNLTLAASFGKIVADLALPNHETQKLDENTAAVSRWLETHDRWLLIFDNLDEPNAVKPFRPKNPNGRILLTSRSQRFESLGVANPIALNDMTPADAYEFLWRRLMFNASR